jgi:hypothetical protein
VGVIAIGRGTGILEGLAGPIVFEAGDVGDPMDHNPDAFELETGFDISPFLFADLTTQDGLYPARARTPGIDGDGFEVFVEEDISRDCETRHAPKAVEFVAFGPAGPIYGDTFAGIALVLARYRAGTQSDGGRQRVGRPKIEGQETHADRDRPEQPIRDVDKGGLGEAIAAPGPGLGRSAMALTATMPTPSTSPRRPAFARCRRRIRVRSTCRWTGGCFASRSAIG